MRHAHLCALLRLHFCLNFASRQLHFSTKVFTLTPALILDHHLLLRNRKRLAFLTTLQPPQRDHSTAFPSSSRMGKAPGDKRYLTTELDGVWTADVTKMRKLCLLAFMDLGTRQVIRHRLMLPFGLGRKASCQDVVALMSSVISSRQRPRPQR